ncbi:HPr kinase/phosphorylase [Paracoccus pacificus]|uniref:HPr kinase/phosphorylase n=1 Tax=Paracoccus pacificus TaxID=1463598 RepID=A0ABW4RB61_9RHOB
MADIGGDAISAENRLDVPDSGIVHATAVDWRGRGALILGPSGSGKSTLALWLMAWGARLVSDDGVMLRRDGTAMGDTTGDKRGETGGDSGGDNCEDKAENGFLPGGKDDGRIVMTAPGSIAGRIEARGLGLLAAKAAAESVLVLVVDLSRAEPDRLPPQRRIVVLGQRYPLVLGAGNDHLAPALLQMLRCGRVA